MSSSEQSGIPAKDAREPVRRSENLAMLYQGLLTGAVRMQAGRQHISDAESFRRRTSAALAEVERDAITSGYDGADVRETHFAVVAFLDSLILNSQESIRAEWERKTLQQEMFGQTDAGVVFFEKLERLRGRRDSQELADMLEVFLLCISLGFEGRYSGGLRGELYSIEDKVRARIESIRGKAARLSPEGLPSSTLPQRSTQPPLSIPYGLVMLGAIAVTILVYLTAKLQLLWVSEQVRSRLF